MKCRCGSQMAPVGRGVWKCVDFACPAEVTLTEPSIGYAPFYVYDRPAAPATPAELAGEVNRGRFGQRAA